MRRMAALIGLSALAACGDPLADFEQYTDLVISDETRPIAAALPTAEEIARPSGPLADLVDADSTTTPVSGEDVPVAAVPAPEADQTEVAAETQQERPAKRGGLVAWLTRQAPKPAPADAEVVEAKAETDQTDDAPLVAAVTPDVPAEPVAEPEDDKPKLKIPPVATDEAEDEVQVASLTPETAIDTPVSKPKARGGLFARSSKLEAKPRKSDVAYGVILPFGEVGRVCEARSKPLGTRVAKSENRGQTYTLYDSVPESAAQRTFYVTGFSDKCPRQFTAAVALFGMPSMHEKLRYGAPSKQYPYSETDKAYEKIKSRICGVEARKPCGGKIETLERDTVFISTYESFTGSQRWADVLIHDNTVVATAIKKIGQRTQ